MTDLIASRTVFIPEIPSSKDGRSTTEAIAKYLRSLYDSDAVLRTAVDSSIQYVVASAGELVYSIGSGSWTGLPIGSTGYGLLSDGANPTWGQVVKASGGTGDMLYHNGTEYVPLASGIPGQVLVASTGSPSWQATALTGGAVLVSTADGVWASLVPGSDAQVLTMSAGYPNWADNNPLPRTTYFSLVVASTNHVVVSGLATTGYYDIRGCIIGRTASAMTPYIALGTFGNHGVRMNTAIAVGAAVNGYLCESGAARINTNNQMTFTGQLMNLPVPNYPTGDGAYFNGISCIQGSNQVGGFITLVAVGLSTGHTGTVYFGTFTSLTATQGSADFYLQFQHCTT